MRSNPMKFTLLTHSKEIPKRSNTGRLVVEVLGESAEQVRWDRNQPPEHLLQEIKAGGVALIYPGPDNGELPDLSGINRCILIDGTWHEARKIHQRSPYLLQARRISIKPSAKSRYNLRKNQKESGLCTAECVIELLRTCGDTEVADRLEERFLGYMRPLQAIKPPPPSDNLPE